MQSSRSQRVMQEPKSSGNGSQKGQKSRDIGCILGKTGLADVMDVGDKRNQGIKKTF